MLLGEYESQNSPLPTFLPNGERRDGLKTLLRSFENNLTGVAELSTRLRDRRRGLSAAFDDFDFDKNESTGISVSVTTPSRTNIATDGGSGVWSVPLEFRTENDGTFFG